MDNQDHRKNHTTGHENHGSHVCHKCGWPFPNPHPSAKHRRHHKKVCGTIEGYKLTNPTNLDEDHKGSGNSEMGELKRNVSLKNRFQRNESSKSVEEVFSDAVAEFGDNGTNPTTETVVAKVAQNPDVNVKGGQYHLTLILNATAGADVIQEPEHPMQGSQPEKPQCLESSMDNLNSNNIQPQNETSSLTVDAFLASSDKETEALAVDGREDRHDSAIFISNVKPEELVNVIPEIANAKPGDVVTDRSLMYPGQSFEGQQNENSDADGHFPHMLASPSKHPSMELSEVDSRLEQMNEFAGVTTDVRTTRINDSVPIDRLVDSKEEHSNLLGPVTPQIDSSSNSCSEPMEVVGIGHMGSMINSERDASAQEVGVSYPGETVDGYNVKAEPNEKMPALSAPTVIPADSHSDITVTDFRNHGPGTSNAHDEVIKEMEDHPKNVASEEDHSSFLLSKSDEGDTCSAQLVVEENIQQEGTVSKSIVEERFNECKTDTSECKDAISTGGRSNGSETHPDALSIDVTSTHIGRTQIVCSIEKQEPHDLVQEILPENPSVIHETGGAATVSTADNEVDRASYAISSNDFPEKATISRGYASNGSEALPDVLSSDRTSIHTGLTQMVCSIEKREFHDSQHDLSQEISPENPTLVHETGRPAMVSPADAEVDGARDAICSSDFPEKATISTGNGSNGSEALPDSVSSDITSIPTRSTQTDCSINTQEAHDSYHDISQEISPENPTLVHETDRPPMVSPAGAEVDGACDAISSSDFPEKATISTGNGSNGLEALPDSEILREKPTVIPEAGGDAVVSTEDAKVDGTSNVISSSSDFPGKAGTDNSNLNGKYIVEGAVEVHQGEYFQEDPKGVDTSRSTDSSLMKLESQAEYVDKSIRVPEALLEDIKVDDDIARLLMSGAENLRLNEDMASALNTESCVPSSVPVEDNKANDLGGDVSDISSLSLQHDGDHNLKHQLSASAVVHRELSVNSDCQTGHMEEEMVPSTINATNEQAILSAETLQVADIRAEEADLKRTLAEESTTCFGEDNFDMESQPLQDKEGTVPCTTNATDELGVLVADTLQASNSQSQKADLKKTFSEGSTAKDLTEDTFEIKSQPLQDDGVNDLPKRQPSASAVVPADVFVDSSSQTDSVEGHWGSVSDVTFASARDANEESAIIATETLAISDTGVNDKDQRANLETKIGTSGRQGSSHSDIFDASSFMTLVEHGRGNGQLTASSEIQTVQNLQQPNSSPLQAGWFPSLAHDVKESEGRKKNEEIIAKVSNWSAGKPHTPLRNLLVEANLESKQKPLNAQEHPATVVPKHEASAQDNDVTPKMTPPMTAPEASTALSATDDHEKEWNIPARLPEIKKEKRKARGNWVPFVCCTSVDLDP